MLNYFKNKIRDFVKNTINNHLEEVQRESNNTKGAQIGNNTRFSERARVTNNQNIKELVRIGNNCVIYGDLLIYKHGGIIEIGDYCFLGENSKIWSSVKIKIGNNVLISHDVNIHDNNSHPLDSYSRKLQSELILTKGLPDTSFGTKEKEIIISNNVWIGHNACIGKGVKIGEGAIVAAGSYVYHDIPDFAIVMGNPAKIISKAT